MMRCVIVDDEQHAVDLLADHISKLPWLELQFATTRSIEAHQYLHQHTTDLVFLDIQMPQLDGMQLLKLLKGKSKVILTTAFSEYAVEGYEFDIVDYLLKPIVFERFLKAAQKAADMIGSLRNESLANQPPDSDFIFVKTDGRSKIVRVLLDDIEYVKGLGNYVTIYTTPGKIITLLTIRELEEKLPAQQFIRIHNSYIVPIKKIVSVQGNQVQMGSQHLSIGEAYKKSFLGVIEKHLIRNKK